MIHYIVEISVGILAGGPKIATISGSKFGG